MCDEKKVIVEAVLKKLQDFDVIEEFTLQPLEDNEENWNKFKPAFTTFIDKVNELEASNKNTNQKETLQAQNLDIDSNNKEEKTCNRDTEEDMEIQVDIAASDVKADLETQEVSNMGTNHEENRNFDLDSEVEEESPVSDTKACENTAWKVRCVSDMDSSREANQSSYSNSDNDVEMNITSEQMRQQINAAKIFKRQQKDEKNVQQYCGRPYIGEHDPLWGQINTCARVDAVFIPRYNNKSRHKVTRDVNTEGPQTQSSNEAVNQNAVEPEPTHDCSIESIMDTIIERLTNMEQHLGLIDTAGKDVFERLEELEDKVLYLERLSQELLNPPTPDMLLPHEYIDDEDNSDEDITEEEAENFFTYED